MCSVHIGHLVLNGFGTCTKAYRVLIEHTMWVNQQLCCVV